MEHEVHRTPRRSLLAVLVTLLAAGAVLQAPMGRGDVEPNDDFSQAEVIVPGTHAGTLDSSDGDDYYQWVTGPGQIIYANVSWSASMSIYLYLYDASFAQVASHSASGGFLRQVAWATAAAPAPSTYYLRIRSGTISPPLTTYSLDLVLTDQDDAGVAGDAPGDRFTARSILPGVHGGILGDADSDDYYSIPVGAGQVLYANLTPEAPFDADIRFIDPDGATVTSASSAGDGAVERAVFVTHEMAGAETYFIQVDPDLSADDGPHTYSLEVALVDQHDGGSVGDAADERAQAALLSPGTYGGTLGDDDVEDHYLVRLTAGQTVYANVTPSSNLDADVRLYDGSGNTVDSAVSGGTAVVERASWTIGSWNAPVDYVLQVVLDFGSSSGPLGYTLQLAQVGQDDAGTGGDASDTDPAIRNIPANPTDLTPGSFTGLLRDDDERDIYRVSLGAGQRISASVIPAAGQDINLFLFDSAKTELDSASTAPWEVTHGSATAMVVYVWLRNAAGSGVYALTVTVATDPAPAAVTLSPPTGITATGLHLSWTQNSDADFDHYEILYGTSPTSLSALTTVSSRTATTYDVTGLSPGTEYYFIVRVVDDLGLSADSGEVSAQTSAGGGSTPSGFSGILLWVIIGAILAAVVVVAVVFLLRRKPKGPA